MSTLSMTAPSDSYDAGAVATPAAAFRYLFLRWSAVNRGWKATIIGLLILFVSIQS